MKKENNRVLKFVGLPRNPAIQYFMNKKRKTLSREFEIIKEDASIDFSTAYNTMIMKMSSLNDSPDRLDHPQNKILMEKIEDKLKELLDHRKSKCNKILNYIAPYIEYKEYPMSFGSYLCVRPFMRYYRKLINSLAELNMLLIDHHRIMIQHMAGVGRTTKDIYKEYFTDAYKEEFDAKIVYLTTDIDALLSILTTFILDIVSDKDFIVRFTSSYTFGPYLSLLKDLKDMTTYNNITYFPKYCIIDKYLSDKILATAGNTTTFLLRLSIM